MPLREGQSAETRRSFTRADVEALQALTGAPDSGDAVPEALVNGLFSYLLGVHLPGQGTNYLKQETDFVAPAPARPAAGGAGRDHPATAGQAPGRPRHDLPHRGWRAGRPRPRPGPRARRGRRLRLTRHMIS